MKLSVSTTSGNRKNYCKNIIFFVAALSLSSCANMTEQQRIYGEATGIGAGLGAGIGAVACHDSRAACAAGGGLLGGALGYAVGGWQANQIGQMDQQSGYREQTTSNLQQYNARMSGYNYQLGRQIAQYERDIRRGIRDVQGVKMNLATAQKERNDLQAVINRERQRGARSSNATERMNCQNQVRQLEGEIQKLDGSISNLRRIQSFMIGS